MNEWTKERHEEAKALVAKGGSYDPYLRDALPEIDRAWGEIERLKDEVCHAQSDVIDSLNAQLGMANTEIERLGAQLVVDVTDFRARLAHARDTAHGLYQATSRFLRSWDTNEPPLLIDRDIEALRRALDPDEAEACAREAARRDGLEKEIERLKTELRDAIKAHGEADKRGERASRGLSEEEAQRWGEMVAAKLDKDTDYEAILAVEAMRLTRGITDAENAAAIVAASEAPIGAPAHDDERETWITGIVAAAFAVDYETPPNMNDTQKRLSAWIEQGIERGYIDADRGAYVRVDPPAMQSPITDAAIDEAIEQAKASSAPAEDPPTQPPHRERCKPIAGPWVNGATFDERGLMLGSALPSCVSDSATWSVYVVRPHMPPHVSTVSSESAAVTTIRDSLASWCDVSALTLPEAP